MPAEQDRRQGPREAVYLNGYCVNSVVPWSVWALNWLMNTCSAPNQALPVPPLALPSIIAHTQSKTVSGQNQFMSNPLFFQ